MEDIHIKSNLYVAELGEYTVFLTKEDLKDEVEIYKDNKFLIGKTIDKTYE